MSKKIISEQTQDPALSTEQTQYSRREFILTSAKGVGVTALGVTAFAATSLNDSAKVSAETSGADSESDMRPVPRLASLSDFDPDTAVDTWSEPWVWRPDDWPGKQLNLTVVENASPIAITGTGFENVRPLLFSYGGITPGPTIRMPGDSTYYLELRNLLGLDAGKSFVGPYPDLKGLPSGVKSEDVPGESEFDWCLGEHTNGIHSVHTTNMHTHGLHVRPGSNPDGSISDNIILRIMPQADFLAREDAADADCRFLRVNEQVGDANYEFRLGNIGASGAPHPPGTHWYHPHSHGATHNQVASGMAGFFIVEGDVDEAINVQLAGIENPDPQVPTGPYQYRERLMFMQNVNPGNVAMDPDANSGKGQTAASFPTVNGSFLPKVIAMQPGAIERWRVLNGSVDGRGYVRFTILKGPLTICENGQIGRLNAYGGCTPLDTSIIEELKQPITQLAMDGVTLVRPSSNGGYEYYIKDLNFDAPDNPLDFTNKDTPQDRIDKISDCFANEENVKAAYNRPNEVMMAPANRADIFFQAPQLKGAETSSVYTVVAHFDILHNDSYEKSLRKLVFQNNTTLPDWPGDIIVATVVVSGDPVEAGPIDPTALPPVPDYLMPISDTDLTVSTAAEADARDVELGSFRTRVVSYSGWGNADFPIIDAPADFVAENPDLLNLTYGPITPNSDRMVVLPPNIRTMAIDGRKFDPTDPKHPQMWLGSSEEWVVYNNSLSLWSDRINSIWSPHQEGKAVTRAQAETDNLTAISTTTVDHPFHIHVNPFWLSRVDVPLADGTLVNILTEPRWQDVTWLPRGRAVFRSRFTDYVGEYVNHCHILKHEDNGMMQLVEVVASVADSNYVARFKVTQGNMSAGQVTAIYPRVSLAEAFSQNGSFIDANTGTGQVFPGFDIPG